MWTLLNGGIEQTLEAWGICADFEAEFVSKGKDTITLRTTEPFDTATAQWAWDSSVTIWRDRTAVGTGGSIYFQGRVGDIKRVAQGGNQHLHYSLFGPWWLLERLEFEQTRQVFNGFTNPSDATSGATYRTEVMTEVYLGERSDQSYQTNGQQIVEILNWVNECYNPTKQGNTSGRDDSQDVIRIGTIDPAVNIPKTRVNDVYCAEAMVNVLRWSPDCVCFFNYTATPPTLHVRSMDRWDTTTTPPTSSPNLPVVTVNITANQEKEIELSPQYTRQRAGVIIKYKRTDMVDNSPWPAVYTDKYPPSITDYTPDVSRHTIDLQGATATTVHAQIAVSPLAAALSADSASRAAFWRSVDRTLQEPSIDPTTIVAAMASATLDDGTNIDTTLYPNVLTSGQIADWTTGIRWVAGTLAADISYQQYVPNADGTRTSIPVTNGKKTIHQRVIFTNASTGPYSAISSLSSGDPVPSGVAEAVYCSISRLQYAGRITLVAAQLSTTPGLGNALSLIGPANTYSGLLIQSTHSRPHYGELIVTYGPSSRLDAPELVELARVGRLRTTYAMPSGRASGQATTAGDVTLGAATAKENTQHGTGAYSLWSTGFDQPNSNGSRTNAKLDAQNEEIVIERVDSSGAPLPYPTGRIALPLANTEGFHLTIGRMHFTDADSGDAQRCLILHSPPIDDNQDGADSEDDLYVGGGSGGSLSTFRVAPLSGSNPAVPSFGPNTILCHSWSETGVGVGTEGTTDMWILLPSRLGRGPQIQYANGIWTFVVGTPISGATLAYGWPYVQGLASAVWYDYTDIANQHRVQKWGNPSAPTTEDQYIIEPFAVGEILVCSALSTPQTVDGHTVNYRLLNDGCHGWGMPASS